MALTITDKIMRSDVTPQRRNCATSRQVTPCGFPGSRSRSHTTTRLSLRWPWRTWSAQTAASGCPMICAGPEVDALAAELGLSGPHAVVRAPEPPDGCQPSDVSGTTSAALGAPAWAGRPGRTLALARRNVRLPPGDRPAGVSGHGASCAPVSGKTQFWCRFNIQTRIVQSTRLWRIFRFSGNRATRARDQGRCKARGLNWARIRHDQALRADLTAPRHAPPSSIAPTPPAATATWPVHNARCDRRATADRGSAGLISATLAALALASSSRRHSDTRIASVDTACTTWSLSTGVRPRPSETTDKLSLSLSLRPAVISCSGQDR